MLYISKTLRLTVVNTKKVLKAIIIVEFNLNLFIPFLKLVPPPK